MSTLEEREIYLNCKQAKCWASVNIKELMAEKAELQAELDKLRWIPVLEGKPLHGNSVWVCIDGDKYYAWADNDIWDYKNKRWLGHRNLNITHYMEKILPEKPEATDE